MPHPYLPSIWDHPEAEARLAQLWAAGEGATSCAIILAREFNMAVTRNAIVGKVWRLGLIKPATKTATIDNPRGPKMHRRPPRPQPPQPGSTSQYNCQLIELDNCSCRWPFGDPSTTDFFFCGVPEANLAGARPYCAFHSALATGYSH